MRVHAVKLLLREALHFFLGGDALIEAVKHQRVADVGRNEVAETLANHEVGLALEKLIHSENAHAGGSYAVCQRGITAANDVAYANEAGIDLRLVVDPLIEHRAEIRAHSLGDEYEEVSLADGAGVLHLLEERIHVGIKFCDHSGGRTGSDGGLQSDVARAAAHNLNHVAARMGFTRVTKLVNEVDDGVHCGVKADGIVGGGDVVIDRTGDADGGNAELREHGSALEGSVTADGNDTVDTELCTVRKSLLLSLGGLELGATVGIQERAALVDHVGYVAHGKRTDVTADKARVSVVNTQYLDALGNGRANDAADCGIHAGSVSTRGENADSFKLFHFCTSLL